MILKATIAIKIGDFVRHKATGLTGKVIGYGNCQISESYYLTTLKVELKSDSPITPIAEDLSDQWQPWHNRSIRACTLPHFPKPKPISSETS